MSLPLSLSSSACRPFASRLTASLPIARRSSAGSLPDPVSSRVLRRRPGAARSAFFRSVAAAAFALSVSAGTASVTLAGTFYVSPTGNDANDGLTPATAWASLGKVSATPFQPGTQVLFESGRTWRGQLSASSSGTPEAPITYGSFGQGPKPRFYGSDILDKSAFVPDTGTTYRLPTSTAVHSVLASGSFLRSSWLLTGRSSSPATNIVHVRSNPGTWYYDDAADQLYVNSGTALSAESRQLTAVTRDDVVYSNYKNNLVFRDLVADETAKYDAGYAFRIMGSRNVQVLNSEAYRAGKHHFGVINSDGFLGDGLIARYAMPDQGVGGATALVSYSDTSVASIPPTNHVWRNVLVADQEPLYPAYISHGEHLNSVRLENITAIGTNIDLSSKTTASDITVIDGGLSIGAATVDRVRLSGANANVVFWGDATVSNLLIDGYYRTIGNAAAVVVRGNNNQLRFSTITLRPELSNAWTNLMEFPVANAGSLHSVGNIYSSPSPRTTGWVRDGSLVGKLTGEYNLFNNISFAAAPGSTLSLAQWQALAGTELSSLAGDPRFASLATSDFRLLYTSLAAGLVPSTYAPAGLTDVSGFTLPAGSALNAGAFQSFAGGAIPEPAALSLLAPALTLLTRRRSPR